jgi:hypothetical protein
LTAAHPGGSLSYFSLNRITEMADVPPASIPIALEKCDTTSFEKYAQTVFGAVIGNIFKPLGGHKDGGADGFVDADVQEDTKKPTIFFQASKEIDTEGKVGRTIKALKKAGRDPKTLLYATSRAVRLLDKLQNDLTEQLGVNVRIYTVHSLSKGQTSMVMCKLRFFNISSLR